MPAPVSATLTRTASPSRRTPSVMRPPAAQNFSALSTRLAIARSNSSMSSDATVGASPGRLQRQRHALRRGARLEAQRDVVQQLAHVQRLAAQRELRFVQLRQVAQRLHQPRGVARVAQRHLEQLPVVGARRRRRPKRASSVSRQAAVAVSGERRSCDRLLTPSRRKWSSRRSASHCRRSASSMLRKPWLSWPNSSLGLGMSGQRRGSAPGAPASRPSRATAATASLRRRSGRVTTPMIQAASSGGQRHQRDDQAQQRQREAAAQRLDAAFGQAPACWHTRYR